MAQFLIDLWLDGYKTEEEMIKACKIYIKNQLDSAGSIVYILKIYPNTEEEIDNALRAKT